MVKEFKIIIGHPSAQSTGVLSVLSGSEVSGTVLVRLDEPERCKSVKIFLKGKGHVRWTGNQRSETATYVYEERVSYVKLMVVLWDENRSPGPDNVLPAGEHRFPFRFTLPSSLPSSYIGSVDTVGSFYEGSEGWILYKLKAVIFDGLFNIVSRKTPLWVTEAIDVNTPELDRPFLFEKQKTFCFSCVSGPISMTVEVPRTGYCAGEEVPFRVTVENGSNRRIECVARLQQHTLFSVQSSMRCLRRCGPTVFRVTLRSPPIEAHTTSTWVPEDRALTVPMNTPVTINTKTIKRYFQLSMTVVIPNAKNLVITIPITIGNVPSRQLQETQPVTYSEHARSVAPPEASVISEQTYVEPPSYASTVAPPETSVPALTNVNPPSYEDAIAMH